MQGKNEIAGLDSLFQEVGTYRSSGEYIELLEFINGFRKRCHKIAPYNAMLIHMQKPGSTYVATVEEWQKEFNRRPKPGARPLIILRTFGPISFVYELNETEGDDFPKDLENPLMAEGEFSQKELEKFIKNLRFNGFRTTFQNYGTDQGGQVQATPTRANYTDRYRRNYSFMMPFTITLNSNNDPVTQLATIYHELGHVYCGHLGSQGLDYLPHREGLDKQVKEFEAESVCWLLCNSRNINSSSVRYLSGYMKDNKEIPDISIETVLKATAKIERIRNTILNAPRKELRED